MTCIELGPVMAVPGLLVVVFSPLGKVLSASHAWCHLMGYSAEEQEHRNLLDLIHPDDLVTTVCSLQMVRDQGTGEWVSRFRTNTGTYRRLRWSATYDPSFQSIFAHATDITPEEREPSAGDLDRLLPLIAETTPAYLYLYDLEEKRVLYLNRRVTTSLGYTEKDIADYELAFDERLLHPQDRQVMEDIAARVQTAEDGQPIEMEYRLRHRDGSYRWFWNRCVVYARNADGAPTQVVGSLYDIAERKEREDSYRLLFQSSPHPMWVFDMETLNFLAVNRATEQLYGYTQEEFLQMKATDIRPPEEWARFRESIRCGGNPEGGTWIHQTKNGKELSVRVWASELSYMGRDARLVTVLDETEKNNAQQRLVEASETMEAVLNQSPVAIFALDASGEVQTWNPAATGIFGIDEESAIGTELRRLALHRSGILAQIQSRVVAGEPIEGQTVRVRRRDRVPVELMVSVRPIKTEGGRVAGAVAVVADVTAKNLAERELRALNKSLERRVSERTAELQAANQELEDFCFSIAHDLRQPLRAIDGFSRAIIEDYGPQLGEEGGSMLNRVRNATQRLDETIDALLTLSRVTRAQLTRDWVDLAETAHQVVADLRRESPERIVEVHIDPNLRAYGDPTLLRLLVQNLLENAWKFTSNKAEARIEFTVERMDSDHIYTVRDNGAGLDIRYANKLFQPFERLHTRDEFPGHGIGLATCQRVVTRHGGQIALVGAIGKGATALFTLAPGPDSVEKPKSHTSRRSTHAK